MHINTNDFSTKDFWLGVCVLASGYPILRVEKSNNNISTFIFDIPNLQAEQIISKHFNKELILPTKDLIDAIRELKSRLYLGV